MATLIEREHSRHPVSTFEDVGALRRAVASIAATAPHVRAGEPELVATELGTNLLKHAARGGYVLYRITQGGIEFLSVDSGPTPGNLSVFDAAGLGAGLAGIKRMSAEYDYYSAPTGTVVFARLGRKHNEPQSRWRHGCVNVPLGGTGPSGDGWGITAADQLAAIVVDGLGHGDEAALAAQAALDIFRRRPVADLVDLLNHAHGAMRDTRGGVAAACLVDADIGRLTFAGIGNISGQIVCGSDKKQHLLSHPGTLGTQLRIPSVRVQHHRWAAGATLVLTSDGVRSGWDLLDYPDLLGHHPCVVAAVLHRDFTRLNDDATVLVAQELP